MPIIEFETGTGELNDRLIFDMDKYVELLNLNGMSPERIDLLNIKFSDRKLPIGGMVVSITRNKIFVPLDNNWKTANPDEQQVVNTELAFNFFHETQHVIDLQHRSAQAARFVYWIALPQLIYLSTSLVAEGLEPANPHTKELSAAVSILSLPILYSLDPFEIRANNFAKEKLADSQYNELIKIDYNNFSA